MNLKLKATVLMACLGAAAATDGGCLVEYPKLPEGRVCCVEDVNKRLKTFVACQGSNIQYFNDLNDMPNGYCIGYVNGEEKSISTTTCSIGDDCLPSLQCHEGFCVDDNGVREMDRLVTSCVSPQLTDAGDDRAGCPFPPYDDAHKLECHKYWISPKGMEWKRYLQHNPLGTGETYAWAYDEQVCATSGHTLNKPSEEYCTDKNKAGSAVDSLGNVIDSTCPCTVNNPIEVLSGEPFQGYGDHMHLYIYDIMYEGYVKPVKKNNFTPIDLPRVAAEDDKFYLKVVNQYPDEILVYMSFPPAMKGEHVSGGSNVPPLPALFEGWTGPTRTARGNVQTQKDFGNGDAWNSRIAIAPNDNPSSTSRPAMRVSSDGKKKGGFYVPKGYHLRLQVAEAPLESGGGWYQTDNTDNKRNTAVGNAGNSLWVTRANAYSKPDRKDLLFFEPNFNPPFNNEHQPFSFDISAVDGVNANMQVIYGTIDNTVAVPLFQSEDGLLSAEPDFNTESLTSLQ